MTVLIIKFSIGVEIHVAARNLEAHFGLIIKCRIVAFIIPDIHVAISVEIIELT